MGDGQGVDVVEDEVQNEQTLPDGWVWATIEDMVGVDGVFTDGDWVESKDQDPQGDVRLVQLADIGDGVYRNRSNRYLTNAKAAELGCKFLKLGDVLIARMPDPLGRACIFPGDPRPCVTAVDVCIVRSGNQSMNHRWLMFSIDSPQIRAEIASYQSGSTRKRISRGNLSKILFPVPPLPEQCRIVAAIETQFTRLDAGVAALERARANLKRYRGAVLKAACEGRLVPTEAALARAEGRDYESADQLLARILAERRVRWEAEHPGKRYVESAAPDTGSLSELPEGWVWATVEQLASLEPRSIQSGPFGSSLHHSEFQDSGILAIGIDNVLDGQFSMGKQHRISPEKFEQLGKYKARPLDVLITVMATVGRCCVVPANLETAIITKHVYRISVDQELAIPFYLMFALLGGQEIRRQILGETRGQTRPGINGTILKQIAIPVPPFAEQRRIVAEVERRLSVVAALEREVEAALARAARLRQSILKRAFEGRLVEQDLDDEPASALLERIRAAREAPATGGKKSRTRQMPLPMM